MPTRNLTNAEPHTQGDSGPLDADLILDTVGGLLGAVRVQMPGMPSEGVTPIEDETDPQVLIAMGSECLKIMGALERKAERIARQQAIELQRVHDFYQAQRENVAADNERALRPLRAIAEQLWVLGGFGDAKSVTTPFGRFGYRRTARTGSAQNFFAVTNG